MLAGLWSEWTDHATGEVVPNFTMLTMNCGAHPLLTNFDKPVLVLLPSLFALKTKRPRVVPRNKFASFAST